MRPRPGLPCAGHGWLQWPYLRAQRSPAVVAGASREMDLRKVKMLHRQTQGGGKKKKKSKETPLPPLSEKK